MIQKLNQGEFLKDHSKDLHRSKRNLILKTIFYIQHIALLINMAIALPTMQYLDFPCTMEALRIHEYGRHI